MRSDPDPAAQPCLRHGNDLTKREINEINQNQRKTQKNVLKTKFSGLLHRLGFTGRQWFLK